MARSALTAAALAVALSLTAAGAATWMDSYNPVADPKAIVIAGRARFTVLTDALIRLEYADDETFDDSATLMSLNRRLPVPSFTHTKTGAGKHTITTGSLELHYDESLGFTADGLSISLKRHPYSTWRPGAAGRDNLHGTIRTLDRVAESVDLTCLPPQTDMQYYAHCEEGLVSTAGWVLVDDSLRPRINTDSPEVQGWPWPTAPPAQNLAGMRTGLMPYKDWVFFGHGRNYTSALGDYVRIAGRIPLMPRGSLGTGFSRWYAWNQVEETAIMQAGFASHGVPLDLVSIDMDFHPTFPHGGIRSPSGDHVEGWTGYSIYDPLYPSMEGFLAHARRRGVSVNLNLHPAAGVEFHEDTYAAVAAALGMDPAEGRTVSFDPGSQAYMDAYHSLTLYALEEMGVHFWWCDYQHGPYSSVPLLNPTILLNLAHYTCPSRYGERAPADRRAERPLVFGRWGGLGGHRYPIGFAGDTNVKWRVLRYETYFSPTASNVGFSWTHDLGGFEGSPSPQLLTRWIQWGALSAMMRTHSSKLSPGRTLWSYPNPYLSIMREWYRMRARLVPYLSVAQRLAHDTGLQLLRPMYWSYPYSDAAYKDQALHQYFLGPDVWAAPIAAPVVADNSSDAPGAAYRVSSRGTNSRGNKGAKFDVRKAQMNGMVTWTLWVPPGEWIEWGSGVLLSGSRSPPAGRAARDVPPGYPAGTGSFIARNYTLSEVPVFSAPGTIIPLRTLPDAGSSSGSTGVGGITGSGSVRPRDPWAFGSASTSLLGLAAQVPTDLTLHVLPVTRGLFDTASSSSSRTVTRKGLIYDDDGHTTAAVTDDAYYWTDVSCTWQLREAEGDTVTCTIEPPRGKGFPAFPAHRSYSWRFQGLWPAATVTINGKAVRRDQAAVPDANGDHGAWLPGTNAWAYDGPSVSLWVRVGAPVPTAENLTVTLTFPPGVTVVDPLLTSGYARTLARGLTAKDEVDRHYGVVYPPDVEPLLNISAAAARMSFARDAGAARAVLSRVQGHVQQAIKEVSAYRIDASQPVLMTFQHHVLGALYDAAAASAPAPLTPSDPLYQAAMAPIRFARTVLNSGGSAPGQVAQHASDDENEPDPIDELSPGYMGGNSGHSGQDREDRGEGEGEQVEEVQVEVA